MSLSKPESEVGPSVSEVGERTALLHDVSSTVDVETVDHYMFVMRWYVSGFKTQGQKRTLVNVLSICMRHGAPALGLLDLHDPDDYTGYAIYYDDERVWMVARLTRKMPHLLDHIIGATVKCVDDNNDGWEPPLTWEKVNKAVRVSLSMFGAVVHWRYVERPKDVNFEEVLRSCIGPEDFFYDVPIYEKTLLTEGEHVDDYFAEDYKCDPFKSYNLIYYWSVCKRDEWHLPTVNNNKRKRCVDYSSD